MSVATQAPTLTEVLRSWGLREDPIRLPVETDATRQGAIYRASDCAIRVSAGPRQGILSSSTISRTPLTRSSHANLPNGTSLLVPSFAKCLFGPVESDEGMVTAWEWVTASRATGLCDVAVFAGALYGSQPSGDVERVSPLSPIRRDIRSFYRQGSPTAQERELLDEALVAAQLAWATHGKCHHGVVHGDLSVENVVVSHGRIVGVGLEKSGNGPQSWDMAMVHFGTLFGHSQSEVDEATSAYRAAGGKCSDADIEGLAPVFLLAGTAWALSRRHSKAAFYVEATKRLPSLSCDWREAPRWSPLIK